MKIAKQNDSNRSAFFMSKFTILPFNFKDTLFEDLDLALENINKHGEAKINTRFRNACLLILNRISSTPSIISSDEFRDYYYDYTKMRNFLVINNFISYTFDGTNNVYTITKQYQGSCDKLVHKRLYERWKSVTNKSKTRAEKIITTQGLKFIIDGRDMTSKDVESILSSNVNSKGQAYDSNTIDNMKKIVENINSSNTMSKYSARRRGRLYSDITSLSEHITQHLHIDNVPTISLDQHATYFWYLPHLIKSTLKQEDYNKNIVEELSKYNEILNTIIKTNGSLYEYFGNIFNIPSQDVKNNMIGWFCDPNTTFSGIRKDIDEGFTKHFPEIRNVLKKLGNRKNQVSLRSMFIEGKVFNNASKNLNKLGFKTITKFDCLIIKKENEEEAIRKANDYIEGKIYYRPLLKVKVRRPSSQLPSVVSSQLLHNSTLKEREGKNKAIVYEVAVSSHILEQELHFPLKFKRNIKSYKLFE